RNRVTVTVRPQLDLFQLAYDLRALFAILEPFDRDPDDVSVVALNGELHVDRASERGVTAWPVASDSAVVDYGHSAFEGFADRIRGADIGGHIFVVVLTSGQRAIKSVDHNKGRRPT